MAKSRRVPPALAEYFDEDGNPVLDRCPCCHHRGLVVTGSRAEGQVHSHVTRGLPALGIPGGCGYLIAWRPQPPFKSEMREEPIHAY